MKRRNYLLISLAIGAAATLFMVFGNEHQVTAPRFAASDKAREGSTARHKPICSSVVNPNVAPPTDCTPLLLTKLPPDPGPAGKLTIEGIDADQDGVRDDVQRYIAIKYGTSERAVKALTLIAKSAQSQVLLGDSVTSEQAYEIAQKASDIALCYVHTVDQKIRNERALDFVNTQVTNTPDRFERYRKFDRLLANRVFLASEAEVPEACGYDPAALPN